MLGVCRQVDHQNDNMEWMMSYFEAMKSQLVSEVSKQITDIVIGSIQEGLSKMDEACEQQAIRMVKFAAEEIAKEKEERKLDIKEAISQNRIENLTHMRDENELRNSIFIKGPSSKEEATEAINVITDNPEVVVLSIEIVSKGRGYREHRFNEPKGFLLQTKLQKHLLIQRTKKVQKTKVQTEQTRATK